MKAFPMFIKTTDRRVVIVGGGEEAAQKARLMLKTDAALTLVAPELEDELQALVGRGRATQHRGPVTPETFAGAALTFVGTGCPAVDTCMHDLAKAGGALVNVVDRPELCDATTPSLVDRDPVVVAIGTEGTAPVLARRIKTDVEAMLSPRLGALAALSGSLRDAVAAAIPRPKRRAFWAWVFGGAPALMHRAGDEAGATQLMEQAIAANGDLTTGTGGAIALVGAGPGARDLLTLRAVERLQEADVIFYDRLVDPEVLELARRDAERVYVGKTVGACAWPQAKISQLIVAEAKKGRRVVRLKSGDPAIFGRATEELEAARDQAIPVEIVPGVTAASAAAASFNASLTERGETDTLVVTTGTCRPGDPDPQWAHHVRAGATLAVYMGVSAAPRIAEEVMLAGAMPDTRVEVAVDVSKSSERRVTTTLGALAHDLETADVTGSAIILMKFRKSQIQVAAIAAE